jgi:DNA-binding CsgD family transcriptional regulator
MEENELRLRNILAVALIAIVIGGTTDLILDAPRNWLTFHVLFELTMTVGALLLVTWLWLHWWRAERSGAELRQSLASRQAERDAWRASARRALEGLGLAVDEQFRTWQLTPAERQVALQLLKGHSHKRIGRLTGRSEHTIRQHATSIYEKAGLAGRAELAAFFLEDLMLPEAGLHTSDTNSNSPA